MRCAIIYTDAKTHGLIVDYLGVFENVAKALDYDPKEIEGIVESIESLPQNPPPRGASGSGGGIEFRPVGRKRLTQK